MKNTGRIPCVKTGGIPEIILDSISEKILLKWNFSGRITEGMESCGVRGGIPGKILMQSLEVFSVEAL